MKKILFIVEFFVAQDFCLLIIWLAKKRQAIGVNRAKYVFQISISENDLHRTGRIENFKNLESTERKLFAFTLRVLNILYRHLF